jgi:hypothetical protein
MSNWGLCLDSRTAFAGIASGDGTQHTAGNAAKAASPTTIGTAGYNWHGFALYVVAGSTARFRIDVEIGASNAVICEDLYLDATGANANNAPAVWYVPIPVPDGTDIKVRAMSTASGQLLRAAVVGIQTDFRGYARARRVACISAWSVCDPQPIVTETGTTETAYQEITASTASRYAGIYLTAAAGGDTARTAGRRVLRLAVGAAGSERVIWTSLRGSAGNQQVGTPEGPFPLGIAAGQRLSFTAQSSAASADSAGLAVHGLIV